MSSPLRRDTCNTRSCVTWGRDPTRAHDVLLSCCTASSALSCCHDLIYSTWRCSPQFALLNRLQVQVAAACIRLASSTMHARHGFLLFLLLTLSVLRAPAAAARKQSESQPPSTVEAATAVGNQGGYDAGAAASELQYEYNDHTYKPVSSGFLHLRNCKQ